MKRATYIRFMALLESMKAIADHRPKYKIQRALRYYNYLFISWLENKLITAIPDEECFIAPKSNNATTITASLTTFPARIKEVKYAIKSIMLQTTPPDRVVLWLAESQFPEKQVPENLTPFIGHGLEVRFCEDLRSHKKYYYALQEQQPNELVVTFDDDIIYHPHSIERLLEQHAKYPDCIVCNSAHIITFAADGNVNDYHKWGTTSDGMAQPSMILSPLTGSGCMYPYGMLPLEAFDKERIKTLALSADDLWICFMSKIANCKICVPEKVARTFSVVSESQTVHLGQVNCIGDGNNQVMKNLRLNFSVAFDRIVKVNARK